MKNNKKLAIALTLAAGLLSGTAMAATTAGTQGIGGLAFEVQPVVLGEVKDNVLWPVDGTMTSEVIKNGGTLFSLSDVIENIPDVYTDFIPDFAGPHFADFTPRDFTPREVQEQAGAGLLVALIADVKIRELPYRDLTPREMPLYDPIYEKVADFRPREIIKLDMIETSGGEETADSSKAAPVRIATLARAHIVTGGGADDPADGSAIGGSFFELPVEKMEVVETPEPPVEPLLDRGALIALLEKKEIDEKVFWEKELIYESKAVFGAKDIFGSSLVSQIDKIKVSADDFFKDPEIRTFTLKFTTAQWGEFAGLGEKIAPEIEKGGLRLSDGVGKITEEMMANLKPVVEPEAAQIKGILHLVKEDVAKFQETLAKGSDGTGKLDDKLDIVRDIRGIRDVKDSSYVADTLEEVSDVAASLERATPP